MVLRLLARRRRERLVTHDVETIPRSRLSLVLGLAVGLASLPMAATYILLVLSSFADHMLTGPDIFSARYGLWNWEMLLNGTLGPAAGRLPGYNLGLWILNTLLVALGVTVVVTVSSVLAGYAFSRMRFAGREKLMQFIILLHAFPGVALIIAVFALYVWSLKLLPVELQTGYAITYTVIARAALEIPMSIWLMKGFFDQVPWEIEWSAIIDGASRIRVWWQIVLPLVKPGIAAVAIFAFLAGWEDLIYVLVFLKPRGVLTLATFIESLLSEGTETAYLPVVAAAGTLYLIPTIAFFLLTQKLLLQTYTGGVKG